MNISHQEVLFLKKMLLFALCLTLLLCGCDQKAKPFYETSSDAITLTTLYDYYFRDDEYVLATWNNQTEGTIHFTDEFRLEKLSGNTWYTVSKTETPVFRDDYTHFLDAKTEGLASYDVNLYLDELAQQTTYRLSTYCYDDDGNYYQVYAEFICDDKAAENEVKELMGAADASPNT